MRLLRGSTWALIAAVCLLTSAAACGREPEAAVPATKAAEERQIRGFSIQLNDPNGEKNYLAAIDELAKMGCTSVNFVIAARQKNVEADSISVNFRNIPPLTAVDRILRHAKERGMYTMLMPIVLLDNAGSKEWRGVIRPPDWDTWFDSYTEYMKKMSQLAARSNVDLLCVGSELLSTEKRRENWLRVIGEIKQHFKGKLTYSANWDHYTVPTFWDQVDYIGMNNYNELAKKPGVPVEQLVKNWGKVKQDILDFVKKEKKPFFFTEVGWHNLQNTLAEPWNYVAEGAIDLEEQKRAFESFVEAWKEVGTTQYMGAYIWEWRPGARPTDHGQYSLQGTPALEVVKGWMKAR